MFQTQVASEFSILGWSEWKQKCRAIRPHLTDEQYNAVSIVLAEIIKDNEKNGHNNNNV